MRTAARESCIAAFHDRFGIGRNVSIEVLERARAQLAE